MKVIRERGSKKITRYCPKCRQETRLSKWNSGQVRANDGCDDCRRKIE